MTGRGGWPMSVFLTPDLKPFYGGTYFPPTARGGMPGFDQVLLAVDDAWQNRRDHAEDMGDQLVAELKKAEHRRPRATGDLSRELIDGAVAQLARSFDATLGRLRRGAEVSAPDGPAAAAAPLAPHRARSSRSTWSARRSTAWRPAASTTTSAAASPATRVDARWLVPHFEKMLYDNALLAGAYVEALQATGDADYARVARETLDYVLRDMTDPAGGFYSTEDADSEGEEGKFYVWTPDEIDAVLGDEAGAIVRPRLRRDRRGQLRGAQHPQPAQDARAVRRRSSARDEAKLPRDACRVAAEALRRPREAHPARQGRQGDRRLERPDDRRPGPRRRPRSTSRATPPPPRRPPTSSSTNLLRDRRPAAPHLAARQGQARRLPRRLRLPGQRPGLALRSDVRRRRGSTKRRGCADVMLAHFADAQDGGFFYTADDHEQLIARNKDVADASTPSASAHGGDGAGAARQVHRRRRSTTTPPNGRSQPAVGFMQQAPTAMGQIAAGARLPTWARRTSWSFAGDPAAAATKRVLGDLRAAVLPQQDPRGARGQRAAAA